MKILVIHNFHRTGSASGDDQVYKDETALLEEKGHTVVRYSVSNDVFDSANPLQKMLFTLGMFWSRKYYKEVRDLIKREKPDIVHIHTFFPLLSPSILYAAKRCKVPVVATLHDTRFVCPCSTSLRGEKICNECLNGSYFRMFRYGCFKNSRLMSLIVACIFKYHRVRKTFYQQIDQYICLNNQQIDLLLQAGFDPKKIVKKYNFVPEAVVDPTYVAEGLPERYVAFFGRLGAEKGVHLLMQMWDRIADIPLVIMGTGPLEEEVRAWADKKKNVSFIGYMGHEKCLAIASKAEFVVFPSIWYEGCSMVEIETESLGKPLIVFDLGFSAEAIQDGVNGYKVPYEDVRQFEEKIKLLWKNPEISEKLGANARKHYLEHFMPESNYKQLIKIYENVMRWA